MFRPGAAVSCFLSYTFLLKLLFGREIAPVTHSQNNSASPEKEGRSAVWTIQYRSTHPAIRGVGTSHMRRNRVRFRGVREL